MCLVILGQSRPRRHCGRNHTLISHEPVARAYSPLVGIDRLPCDGTDNLVIERSALEHICHRAVGNRKWQAMRAALNFLDIDSQSLLRIYHDSLHPASSRHSLDLP
jgi:hypothetical protein